MLDDYKTAPIDERLRAALTAIEKLTLRPETFGAEDVRAACTRGVSEADLADAFYVAFVFNIMDRLADTLGWEVPDASFFRRGAKMLLKRGYTI